MVLESHAEQAAALRKVFTVYGAFWIGVLVVLFIATGLLLRRADALNRKQHGGPGGHH